MPQTAVMRLFSFRTVRPAFDSVVREVLIPDLRALPGAIGVWAGRQGPDEVGARMLASVWGSTDAMRDAIEASDGDGRFHAEQLQETTDRRTQTLPIVFVDVDARPLDSGILRVARGDLRHGDLETYARLVLRDVAELRAGGSGPASVALGAASERSFVMLSTWLDWSAIEAATGASISEPLRTKRSSDLREFAAQHFELLPELPAAQGAVA